MLNQRPNTAQETGVSVIMPAYNSETTISRAVDSVLGQTHALLELILVDDCSTDKTREIMEQYAKRDPRVRVVQNKENCGVSLSRSHGIEEAKYNWICFLDSDDFWRAEKLERQLDVLEKDGEAVLCFTASAFIDDAGHSSDYILHAPEKVTFQELLYQNVISCSSVMVRRDWIKKCPVFRDKWIHEDYACWLTILKEVPYALGVDEPLLIYQVSADSKSGDKKKAVLMQLKTYRHIGLPLWKTAVCFTGYLFRGLRKHMSIKGQMH